MDPIGKAIEKGREWAKKKVPRQSKLKTLEKATIKFHTPCLKDEKRILDGYFWFGVMRQLQDDLTTEFEKYNVGADVWRDL